MEPKDRSASSNYFMANKTWMVSRARFARGGVVRVPDLDVRLSSDELESIARYTVQKIDNYPKWYGKTVENYFHLLFPDEVKNYIAQKEINRERRMTNV